MTNWEKNCKILERIGVEPAQAGSQSRCGLPICPHLLLGGRLAVARQIWGKSSSAQHLQKQEGDEGLSSQRLPVGSFVF